MLICPDCGAENLDGADECQACSQSLTELSTRMPVYGVETGLLRDRVSEIPTHLPVTVSSETSVGEVLSAMVARRIGCVLVVDEEDPDRLAGIFTERDALMRLNIEATNYRELPISKFMTQGPATIAHDDKIAYALRKMNVGGYRHLPVLRDEQPESVISVRDLLQYLTEHGAAVK